jgi:hypothetical protein
MTLQGKTARQGSARREFPLPLSAAWRWIYEVLWELMGRARMTMGYAERRVSFPEPAALRFWLVSPRHISANGPFFTARSKYATSWRALIPRIFL